MKKWYALRALSGKEKQVAERISFEAKMQGLSDFIESVMVPTENVVEMREGKKRTRSKVFFPGYILIKMEMTSETEFFMENLSGVMSFVGPKGQPQPLHEDEVRRIIGEVEEKDGREVMGTLYREGDPVKIVDGPFIEFSGVVKEVNEERRKLKVEVSIFGRSTPVELDYLQVELEK
ncbi:MAG TPA: transcription termination/antitermination factor NusG [Candidatus Marinimicrobia bacterium]|nr:transcription termination/antitermination factor NusG [Candidatus Neomarinimicrobiota bacterium]